MEVFPTSQFDIEDRYRSICDQLPQDLETKLNAAFDITDDVMDITNKPESYTQEDKQKLAAAIKANFELHEDLFTWYLNAQTDNVSNIKELFTVSVKNQDYKSLEIAGQKLNLTISLDIKGNYNESAPINLTPLQLKGLK